jgi:hypothetical protein
MKKFNWNPVIYVGCLIIALFVFMYAFKSIVLYFKESALYFKDKLANTVQPITLDQMQKDNPNNDFLETPIGRFVKWLW